MSVRKSAPLLLLCASLAAAFSAQAQTTDKSGYLTDSRGELAKSGFGLCWRTGSWTPAQALAECDPDLAQKPAAKPAAPAAAKPAEPAPAKPAAPKNCAGAVTFQSEELFDFNKTALRPAARGRIDVDLLPKINGCKKLQVVLVTAHTDRLGSHQYNQKLSEKRAAAVKDYLVKKGVAADKIETMGAGKTQPAKGGCADSLKRKDLIACLAPNRRAVVEIKGTME